MAIKAKLTTVDGDPTGLAISPSVSRAAPPAPANQHLLVTTGDVDLAKTPAKSPMGKRAVKLVGFACRYKTVLAIVSINGFQFLTSSQEIIKAALAGTEVELWVSNTQGYISSYAPK